jgi:hypothetical protein
LLNYEGELKIKLQDYKKNPTASIKDELLAKPYSLPSTAFQNPYNINVNAVANAAVTPLTTVTTNNITYLENKIAVDNKKYSDVFQNWRRTTLMSTYADLNEYVDSSIKLINTEIQKLPFQNDPLALPEGNPILPINNPVELYNKFKPNLLIPSAAVLVTHLFILIPFFTEKVRKYGSSYTDHNVREI